MIVAWMGLLAASAFAAMVALGVHVGYPWVRRWIIELPPTLQTRVVFALVAAPAVFGVALSLLALLPGVAAPLAPALDHCKHHGDHHFHLCLVHGPGSIQLGRIWLVLGLLATPVLIRVALSVARLLRGRRLLSVLRRSARSTGANYHEVSSEAPFAVTAGLWRPRVYVTSGLLRHLDDTSRAAVLAHEAAHVRRHDPLMKLLADLLSTFHLPKTRQALLADLSLACEQACDEEAAFNVGDRTAVADALVKLGRLVSDGSPTGTAAVAQFGEGSITARVHALLGAPKAAPRLPSARLTLAASLVLATMLSAPVHHATETVLGALFG